MDLTTATPAEIDEAWAEALAPVRALEVKLGRARKEADHVREQAERFPGFSVYENAADEAETHRALVEEQADAAHAILNGPFADEWDRRGGWTRYYLVPGGHLHRYACHTLTPGRTLVGLLTEASGLDNGEVVAKYDATACTKCFADAPVAGKLAPEEEGFCKHSGTYAGESLVQPEKWGNGRWALAAVAPGVRCECGYVGSITKSGKFRKHKAGG